LVPDGTIVLHLAAIIVMVALLNATLLKPINRVLEKRERLTKGRLTQAQRVLAKIDEELREYERRLREARSEGYALVERERVAMSLVRERRVAQMKAEITRDLSEQREKLSIEVEQVKLNLEKDARTMAIDISRQILHRPIIAQPGITNGRG
jgi:F-type H+-transporting ATPase subunit b